MLEKIKTKILQGGRVTAEEAETLINLESPAGIDALLRVANEVRKHFRSDKVDLCSLVNAKSGLCGEDCAFCAQSTKHNSDVTRYALLPAEEMVRRAQEAEKFGAKRFCIVTSGGRLTDEEFRTVLEAFRGIRESTNLKLDASLGFLTPERIAELRETGVTRFNHNLETSPEFYPEIVSTHKFEDRVNTVKKLKDGGMEICSGGIIGMGESRRDRVRLALKLRELGTKCVPINILYPKPGTPLEKAVRLNLNEILKTVAVFRLVLPEAVIKIAGGREHNLGKNQDKVMRAGANGLIIGGYLTTGGNKPSDDIAMCRECGFEV